MFYEYKHPNKEEYVTVDQGMNDVHEYTDKDNVKWERVFDSPQVSMGTNKMDPFSQSEYIKRTRDQKGTVGDLIDQSQELSQKRADLNGGVDPVEKKYLKDYSDARAGKKHHSEKPKGITKDGVKVDF